MTSSEWKATATYAFICVVLFIGIFTLGLGTAFLFVPAIPLLMLGLRYGFLPLAYGLLAAVLLIAILGSPTAAFFFLAYAGIPTLLFAPRALLFVPTPGKPLGVDWYPVGILLTDLAFYAALAVTGIELHLAESGGLQTAIATTAKEGFKNLDPNLQQTLEMLTTQSSFLLVGITVWYWCLLFYSHAWIANMLLKTRGEQLRTSLSLTPFHLPSSLLLGFTAIGLWTLTGTESAFLAKCLMIILLLPYFLLGLSHIQTKLKDSPSKSLLLFTLYFMTLALAWPALFIAGVGLWQQCKGLSRQIHQNS